MKEPDITIKEIQNMKLIYVRFRGTYIEFKKQSKKMFETLFKFAQTHNLIVENETKVLSIYHDNPFITKAKDLRTSVAMTVPLDIEIEENDVVSVMYINGKYGVGHFELSLNEYGKAWEYMYNKWLFKENIEPRDTFPFELYITEPPKNFKDRSFTDIYIPIN